MSAMSFSPTLRNARATAIKDALDAGSAGAVMAFYTAPRPAAGAAVTTQTHLGDCALSKPCGSVASQALTLDTITDGAGLATGAAVWCRISDSAGAWVIDADVSDATGTAPVKIGTVDAPSNMIFLGGAISVSSGVITEGNA
ncbi:hypothetical protein BAC2_00256 [uncultured bacterium]|nr:hypothetical protein BAC2_00256 [uncultured bacterium]